MKRRNSSKIICMDFYGLPGSGKSTISHLLATKLRSYDHVFEPSYYYDHNCTKARRVILKTFGVLVLFISSSRMFVQVCKILVECNLYPTSKAFYINLLNLAYKFNALNRKNNGVVIFDQGFLQSVISMYFRNHSINETIILKKYEKIKMLIGKDVDIRNVYIKTDIDTVVGRLANRHTNVSRVQALDLAEMRKELAIQKSIFDIAPCSIIVDSGDYTVTDCVGILLEKMNINK